MINEEAIEILKDDEMYITDSFYREFRTIMADKYTKAFRIVLNLIEKQQKEIENWEKYCDEQEENITEKNNKIFDLEFKIEKQKAEIEDKQDEINVLEAQRDSIENQFEQAKVEIEKKDKMIDLMAIAIDNEPLPTEAYCIFRNFDCPAVGGNRDCKQCIKQYFEKKAEEEK